MDCKLLDIFNQKFGFICENLNNCPMLFAATRTFLTHEDSRVTFGLAAANGERLDPATIVVDLRLKGSRLESLVTTAGRENAEFYLQARSEDWQAFFSSKEKLVRPYQSYWGMLRVLAPQNPEVCIIGNLEALGKYARVWRMALDRIRDVITLGSVPSVPKEIELPLGEETNEDAITGKYTWITHGEYGKVKIFYETSGQGDQYVLFLHTAGSDSRQYHSLMNNVTLLKSCTMYAFDLPGHGRSSLGTALVLPDSYTLSEQSYLECIRLIIDKLNLTCNDNLILSGASMGGHVCLAAAINAHTMGVRGVIPCEACAHLPFNQPIYEISGSDSSILDPERVCGMIAPTSPPYYARQIWWQYSSQGIGVFRGDLKFYFKGWDGRARLGAIDTGYCPVYMLTGEFDYSCTAEASEETAGMIKGARFEIMKGLGHFPLTENPALVAVYLERALDFIQKSRT